jgi:hypothetical protein
MFSILLDIPLLIPYTSAHLSHHRQQGGAMNPEIEQIIGRAMTNREFRDELIATPESTLHKYGYALSDSEIREFSQTLHTNKSDQDTFNELNRSVW